MENLPMQRRRVRPMYNNSAWKLHEGVRNRESSHVFIPAFITVNGRSRWQRDVSLAVVEARHVVFIILS